jgi:hypothetical protein
VILAAVVVAIPLGLVAAVAGPQLASAGQVYFPITCAVSGTITYTPPLSTTGVISTNPLADESTTIAASMTGCLSSNTIDAGTTTGTANLSVNTPPLKGSLLNGIGKGNYATGRCADFASAATLKALKGLPVTVTWSGQGLGATGSSVFSGKGAIVASNGSTGEAGFNIVTAYISGDYTVKAGQTTAFLNNTGAIATCATGGPSVSSSTIDSAVSTITG